MEVAATYKITIRSVVKGIYSITSNRSWNNRMHVL